jgi:hypothetical protein
MIYSSLIEQENTNSFNLIYSGFIKQERNKKAHLF